MLQRFMGCGEFIQAAVNSSKLTVIPGLTCGHPGMIAIKLV